MHFLCKQTVALLIIPRLSGFTCHNNLLDQNLYENKQRRQENVYKENKLTGLKKEMKIAKTIIVSTKDSKNRSKQAIECFLMSNTDFMVIRLPFYFLDCMLI